MQIQMTLKGSLLHRCCFKCKNVFVFPAGIRGRRRHLHKDLCAGIITLIRRRHKHNWTTLCHANLMKHTYPVAGVNLRSIHIQ